jgi:hypothetical protein
MNDTQLQAPRAVTDESEMGGAPREVDALELPPATAVRGADSERASWS